MKREKGRERVRIECEYKRENCHKVVVQISFLHILTTKIKPRHKPFPTLSTSDFPYFD